MVASYSLDRKTKLSLLSGVNMNNFENSIYEIANSLSDRIKRHGTTNKGRYFNFVFLCGGYIYEGDNRSIIRKILESRNDIKCLYSEELIKSFDFDLLSFEEFLMEISSRVIIILESYGSACELGAFTYQNETLHKVIVINDKKMEGQESFINSGPIRKVAFNNQNHVFFEEFKESPLFKRNVLIASKELRDALRNDINKERTFSKDAISVHNKDLIITDIFMLMLIIFEIIKFFGALRKNEVIEIICKIYKVNNIVVEFSTKNRIKSKNGDEKFIKFIQFLINLLVEFDLLAFCRDFDYYRVNFNLIKADEYDFIKFSSVLFNSDFLKRNEYILQKGRAITVAKKRGFKVWEE